MTTISDSTSLYNDLRLLWDAELVRAELVFTRYGLALPEDGAEARSLAKRYAERGDPEFQHIYAKFCQTGLFGPRDEQEALRWCRLAASSDYGPALFLLSNFYQMGWGDVAIDSTKARALLNQAAELGDTSAMTSIASELESANPQDAEREYSIASEKGNANAMCRLGQILLERGDTPAGIRTLKKAARLGHSGANSVLSSIYRYGEYGVDEDLKKAKFFLERSESYEPYDVDDP